MKLEALSIEDLALAVVDLQREELLFQTQAMVAKERDLTVRTLVLFREIESRMIHLEMGFSSLFDMLVKYFALSEGSASRRVASIRLMTQIPGVEDQIKEGLLSLSNVAAAQRFFTSEAKHDHPLPLEVKKEVLDSLVGKSAREAEKELSERSSLPICLQAADRIKPKGQEYVEIRFVAPQELADLLEEAKGLLSHRLPGGSLADVIHYLAETSVEKIKKERYGVGSKSEKSRDNVDVNQVIEEKVKVVETVILKNDIDVDVVQSAESTQSPETSRYIPKKVRRAVYARAQGKCEYTHPSTGNRCNSKRFLELDHRIAFAKGGRHTTEGLLLACRPHNSFRARQDFGPDWMNQFKKKG